MERRRKNQSKQHQEAPKSEPKGKKIIYFYYFCFNFYLKPKAEQAAKEEEPPAKVLEDLFRKTNSTPCIYWLPLTDEEVIKHYFICYYSFVN